MNKHRTDRVISYSRHCDSMRQESRVFHGPYTIYMSIYIQGSPYLKTDPMKKT